MKSFKEQLAEVVLDNPIGTKMKKVLAHGSAAKKSSLGARFTQRVAKRKVKWSQSRLGVTQPLKKGHEVASMKESQIEKIQERIDANNPEARAAAARNMKLDRASGATRNLRGKNDGNAFRNSNRLTRKHGQRIANIWNTPKSKKAVAEERIDEGKKMTKTDYKIRNHKWSIIAKGNKDAALRAADKSVSPGQKDKKAVSESSQDATTKLQRRRAATKEISTRSNQGRKAVSPSLNRIATKNFMKAIRKDDRIGAGKPISPGKKYPTVNEERYPDGRKAMKSDDYNSRSRKARIAGRWKKGDEAVKNSLHRYVTSMASGKPFNKASRLAAAAAKNEEVQTEAANYRGRRINQASNGGVDSPYTINKTSKVSVAPLKSWRKTRLDKPGTSDPRKGTVKHAMGEEQVQEAETSMGQQRAQRRNPLKIKIDTLQRRLRLLSRHGGSGSPAVSLLKRQIADLRARMRKV